MKRIILGVASMVLGVGVAGAFTIPDAPPLPPMEVGNCTNFSGNYTGSCSVEGKQVDDTFKVEQQGCELFRVRGKNIPVGSLVTVTVASPAVKETPATGTAKGMSITWDKDQKTIQLNGGTMVQTLATNAPAAEHTALAGEARLEGDKLLISMKTLGKEGKEVASCVYVRK